MTLAHFLFDSYGNEREKTQRKIIFWTRVSMYRLRREESTLETWERGLAILPFELCFADFYHVFDTTLGSKSGECFWVIDVWYYYAVRLAISVIIPQVFFEYIVFLFSSPPCTPD